MSLYLLFFFLRIRRPPKSTRTDTRFPYTTLFRSDTWQGTAGVRGVLPNDWGWEVAGSFGRNTAIDGSTNIANLERVADTLDTSQCSFDAGAAIPCADYLGFGDRSQAVQDYILRSDERRVGKECVSTCRSRW